MVNVGLIGLGTVGLGVARLLSERREMLARRLGRELVLKRAAEIDPERRSIAPLAPEQLTARDQDILEDPDIDIVVELIGGTDAARDLVLAAIDRGKHVVTANKALLALHGNEILTAAGQQGVEVAFEAAVCARGWLPIVSRSCWAS